MVKALALVAAALYLAAYSLGHAQTRSELCKPPLPELAETWALNHPECGR